MGASQSVEPVDLKGKTAIVTGANTGIGYITAKELAKMGANVIIACRDPQRSSDALARLKSETGNDNIEALPLDLNSLASVRSFAKEFQQRNQPLNLLINNAGIMALPERQTTEDGFEKQIGVNHFGHFLLTTLLLDDLKKGVPSRVVNVSSEGHKLARFDLENLQFEKPGSYGSWTAYGNSKLANILFAAELQKRMTAEGVDVSAFSLHPGVIKTELGRNMTGVVKFLNKTVAPLFLSTPEQGALTTLFCAVRPEALDNKGKYFSKCAVASTSGPGRDQKLAEDFWKLSEELVKQK